VKDNVFLYGKINISMIVQSITNSWDMVYDQYRKIEYKVLIDPATDKRVVEVVQYLYDKHGQIRPDAKGQNVDIQA
jgi:hypothetical protein